MENHLTLGDGDKTRIIVCLGAGGVGKTTNAVALAVGSALRGQKTALISIDPAQRLARAMGIKLGSHLSEVGLPGIEKGHLKAVMLDQKLVFDEMVAKYTKDLKTREKIFKLPLYRAASSNFGGAVEYLALAKLSELLQSGEYQVIVVDTPPDSHAVDFLNRPNILAGFMEHKVMTWLIKPFHFAQKLGLGKIFSASEKLAGGIAEVTGIKALQNLAEFLVLMQQSINGFHESGKILQEHLRSADARYVIVTTLTSASVRSALHMMDELEKFQFVVNTILVNRVLPEEIQKSIEELSNQVGENHLLRILLNTHVSQQNQLVNLKKSVAEKLAVPPQLKYIFDKNYDIHTPESVIRYARELM